MTTVPPEVAIELEDLAGGLEVAEPVAHARGVDLDALAVVDDAAQDLGHEVPHAREGIVAERVVAADEVEVPEDRVVSEALHDAEQLLVVGAVDLLLRATALEVPVPELEVAHLMDGADDEVETVSERPHEGVVPSDRRGLDAELEARAQRDAITELLSRALELVEVRDVRAVGDRATVLEAGPSGWFHSGFTPLSTCSVKQISSRLSLTASSAT